MITLQAGPSRYLVMNGAIVHARKQYSCLRGVFFEIAKKLDDEMGYVFVLTEEIVIFR